MSLCKRLIFCFVFFSAWVYFCKHITFSPFSCFFTMAVCVVLAQNRLCSPFLISCSSLAPAAPPWSDRLCIFCSSLASLFDVRVVFLLVLKHAMPFESGSLWISGKNTFQTPLPIHDDVSSSFHDAAWW